MLKRKMRWRVDVKHEEEDRKRFKNYLKKLKDEGEKIIEGSMKEENKIITYELE